jgi:hypothetical protein
MVKKMPRHHCEIEEKCYKNTQFFEGPWHITLIF